MKKQILTLLVSIAVLAGLLIAGCAPKAAPAPGPAPAPTPEPEKVWDLRFGHWVPPVTVFQTNVWEPWVETIKQRTNGRVNITIYPAESIGKQFDLWDLTVGGSVDIHQFAMSPRFPLNDYNFLPFVFPSSTVAACVQQEICDKYLQELQFKDVKVNWMFTNAPSEVHMRTAKCIQKLEDFKGQKMHSPGSPIFTEVVKKLGGTPVTMSTPDAYTALQTGVLDGNFLEWEGQMIFKLYLATQCRTVVPESIMMYGMGIMMNKDLYNSFPPDIKQVFDEEGGMKMALKSGQVMDEQNRICFKLIQEYDQKAGNPSLYYLSEDELARWKAATAGVTEKWISDMEAQGYPAQALYDDVVKLTEKYTEMYPPVPFE